MMGFTYNGIHCSEFGLYYIPNADDRWFNDPEYDVYGENISWRNGGYYYNSKAKERTFTLRCGFEEIDVATRQKIKQWVKMGTSGQLIFDDRPFMFWNVHPGKAPVGNWYLDSNESHSGTVTITFITYEPFAYLTRNYNSSQSTDDGSSDYCNLIPQSEMPSEPTTSDTMFSVYNPGTEECGLTIEVGGSASNPIRFFNDNTKTECIIESLPTNNLLLTLDGDTGYVSVGMSGENGFAYHDKGFIKLAPNIKYYNADYVYAGTDGTKFTIYLPNIHVDKSMRHGIITLDGVSGTTFTITDTSDTEHRLTCTRTGSGTPQSSGKCTVQTLNKIEIQEKANGNWVVPTTLNLSIIRVNYRPRVL